MNNYTGKIVKLDIDENLDIEKEVDVLSFVEYPAIEQDWYTFANSKELMESYNDYPEAAIKNAKRALQIRAENPTLSCGTRVGWARANQLANRQSISEETIARMASFARHKQNSYGNPETDCGALMWLAWGGTEGIEWASRKLDRIRMQTQFIISDIDGTLLNDKGEPNENVITYLKNKNLPIIVVSGRFIDRLDETKKQLSTLGLNIVEIHLNDWADSYNIGKKFKRYKLDLLLMDGYDIAFILENEPEIYKGGKGIKIIDVKDILSEEQEAILDGLQTVGITEESLLEDGYTPYSEEEFENQLTFAVITSSPNKDSIDDFGEYKILYRYTGPKDGKNRDFCKQLLSLNLLFRKEDINRLSIRNANKDFGSYDIFRYKGSYNCRHYWERLIYRKTTDVYEADRPLAIDTSRVTDATTINNTVKRANVSPASILAEMFSTQTEKQMIIAPMMRANHLIPRVDEKGNLYHVYFTPETITKIAHKFLKKKYTDQVNINHNPNHFVDDVYLVESWIVENKDKDKSTIYGFTPEIGDWYGMFKVDNKEVWESYIKTGLVRGISVEGYFIDKLIGQK